LKLSVRTSASFALLLLLGLIFLQSFTATEAWGDYNISANGSSISVSIKTVYTQNVTGSSNPVYSTTLSGSNASDAQSALSSALSSLTPGLSASSLEIVSSSSLNTTITTVKFNVNGATSTDRGVLKINMAWKSFKVTSNITSSGISLNSVGRFIAQSPAWGNPSSSLIAWSYSEDGRAITASQSLAAASSFLLLDFSQLSAPLDTWHHTLSVDNGLSFNLSMNLNHNITAKETIHDPTAPFSGLFTAGFSHKVQIVIPGSPTVLGDELIINSGSLLTETMIALSIVFPIVGVVAFFTERRLTSPSRARASRKKNRGK